MGVSMSVEPGIAPAGRLANGGMQTTQPVGIRGASHLARVDRRGIECMFCYVFDDTKVEQHIIDQIHDCICN